LGINLKVFYFIPSLAVARHVGYSYTLGVLLGPWGVTSEGNFYRQEAKLSLR